MITIERTDYAFAELNASPDEWEGLKGIVQHAVDHYGQWELDYFIPGSPEQRQEKLQTLAAKLQVSELPVSLHRDDLAVLLAVAVDSDKVLIDDVDPTLKDNIARSLTRYTDHTLFGGEWGETARLEM